MTPIEMFIRAATLRPRCVAVEAADRKLSYAELLARVQAVAAGLQQIEAEPGARVGICSWNSLDHLIAFLGVVIGFVAEPDLVIVTTLMVALASHDFWISIFKRQNKNNSKAANNAKRSAAKNNK